MRRLFPYAISLGITGCSLEPLSQSWELDRVRILGVRAIPAEPRPGELTTFESLTYLPEGTEMETTLWFACLPDAASAFGCTLDGDALDALDPGDTGELTDEELYEQLIAAGLIGADPFWPPSWTPPEDALDDLCPEDQLEGVSAMINLTLLPTGEADESDQELAFKRVPVSLATHPNHNPDITGLKIDDDEVPLGGHLLAAAGATYEIEPILSEDSIESYIFVDSSGIPDERTEEPYFSWYVEGGGLNMPFSLHPHMSIEWTAPEQPFDGMVVVVARDRRGGMAWAHLRVSVE